MHELGMCEGIVDAVLARASGRPVRTVRVRAGALHRIVEPALQQAFTLTATGTEAADAQVELVVLPVRSRCTACDRHTESDDVVAVCAHCGGTDLVLEGGDELVLESLTVDEPASTAT